MTDSKTENSSSEKISKGLDIAKKMFDESIIDSLEASIGSTQFGVHRRQLATEFVLGTIWSRPGLDLRARSLVTLGILIAQGQMDELKIHLVTAVRNGCSVEEVEEVLYHSTAYAGFPAANRAAHVATEVFKQSGLIE